MLDRIREDIRCVFDRDPAARSVWEVIFLYPGFHALLLHRIAHPLWIGQMRFPARAISHVGRILTGIDIHPGARIGRRFFIDHGMGVVIGETADIGDDVTLYQGVTLGGTSWRREKRHPTVEDGVVIGAGATVLGPLTIGRESKIGAGSVVVRDVPEGSTVVGIPGKVVQDHPECRDAQGHLRLDHNALPDPEGQALHALFGQMAVLQKEILELEARLQIATGTMDDLERGAPVAAPQDGEVESAGIAPSPETSPTRSKP
jgi:serine O-acetyltransferase